MEEKVLTAEELVETHHDKSHFNIPSFGEKISNPTGEENEEIQRRLELLKNSLSTPRVGQRSQISGTIIFRLSLSFGYKYQESIFLKIRLLNGVHLLCVNMYFFSSIIEGEWKNNQVYVHKSFGKHWDVFGRVENQQLLLHPEEALFLLESNSIEIKLNEMPMSLQQGLT